MKKGQILEGRVIRLDFPGKGIVETEEGLCLVKNVLPGQKVSFVVTKKRSGKCEGRLVEVLEKAPCEIQADCKHFGVCGGCSYRSLSYEKQAELKENQVKALLTPVLEKQQTDYIWEEVHYSPARDGYRNKMEFSFGDEVKDGPLSLGMHKKGSFYDIVTVDGCKIVDEDYRAILTSVRDFFAKRNIPFFHRMQHTGYLRHLLVRKGKRTGEILIALVTSSQYPEKQEETQEEMLASFVELLKGIPYSGKLVSVLHTLNDSVADVVRSDRTDILFGTDYLTEEILGLSFKISEFSFFQTNSLGAELLYETARGFIGDISLPGGRKPILYDLYSGTGTIAQMMAPVAEHVYGVEIVEEAVDAAKENAALNHLDNCTFIAGDVLKVLEEEQIKERPDFIIVDPPRDGIHPKALQIIIDFQVDRLLYISCKPTSLARDLELFLAKGYEVERVSVCDQFPFTANIETICLLSKK